MRKNLRGPHKHLKANDCDAAKTSCVKRFFELSGSCGLADETKVESKKDQIG